jgi:threonine synthase
MSDSAPHFACHGCGATIDIAREFPFSCPNAGRTNDDIDHVLVPPNASDRFGGGKEPDPFIRYRTLLSPYRLSRFLGLPDDAWIDIVGTLEERLLATDGRAFRRTPMARQPALAAALASKPRLWVKDETGNVAGSHKGRHLIGVMLYLRVLEAAAHPAAQTLRKRRLAIASCGNAALAAAVVARAAEWPIDTFIPADANPSIVRKLKQLGAALHVCERLPGEMGDPCIRDFRNAVRDGAIPFSVQGPENGLAIEGAHTLALEMAEDFAAAAAVPDAVYVQVGGGALASAIAQGFSIAKRIGLLPKLPRLMLVQTAGCAPIARAWKLLSGASLDDAVRHRSRFMWPWGQTPSSAASGILDDETYDWWEAAKGARETGGGAVVADEATVVRAYNLGKTHTTIRASATGTAGLAGLMAIGTPDESAAVIFSGSDQYAP